MDIRSLEDSIRAHLADRRGEWLFIAQKAGVSHSWISKFVNGHIPNPGLRTLERISTYVEAVPDESGSGSSQNRESPNA